MIEVYTKYKLKRCPFCKVRGKVLSYSLYSDGHGYKGSFNYVAGCVNDKCKIKPRTKSYDDVYRSREEAISSAVADWNYREEKKKNTDKGGDC